MTTVKKNESIPEECVLFFIGKEIVNRYIKAGNDIVLSIEDKCVSISFKTIVDVDIHTSVLIIDMVSMKNNGISVYDDPLLNYPSLKFIGACSKVCQYEILDNINLKSLYSQ
jgi:hypothetical protein